MPKIKPHPLYGHDINTAILKPTLEINLRRRRLPKGAPLPVTAAEEQLLQSSSALMRLMGHTAKLDHAVHFLSQKGRSNTTGNAALQLLGPNGWVEYHLGYFYALHRSTYDSAQWFTSETLNMKLPKHQGFEKKFVSLIAKIDSLVQIFKELKVACVEFIEARNDHLHRGQYVRSGPVMDGNDYDQLLVANAMLSHLRKIAPAKYDASAHKEVKQHIERERKLLVAILRHEIGKIQGLLVRLVDVLEPVLQEQIKAAEDNKGPTPGAKIIV